MQGDDRVRFCDRCRKSVYNLAAMSRSEALTVIRRAEGEACVQLTRRLDGTVTTGDCWTLLRQARRRGVVAFAIMLVVVLAGGLRAPLFGLRALAGLLRRTSEPPAAQDQTVRGMGRLLVVPEPTRLEPERKRAVPKTMPVVPKKRVFRARKIGALHAVTVVTVGATRSP